MTVHHHRVGAGAPLVLIHGIGHRWQAWRPVLERLAAYHDVIAIDLPGFGRSPVPPGGMPPDMPATVAALAAVLADWGIERPHVAGYSLGGAISLELAAGGVVSSATAFSPAGFFTPAERRRALTILNALRANTFLPRPVISAALRSGRMRAMCLAPIVAYPDRLGLERAVGDAIAMRRGRGYRQVARAARGYAFDGTRLAGSDVPVTVGWGEGDRIFRVHQADRVRRALPQARVQILPGCGHVPMSDNPGLVCDLILETTGAVRSAEGSDRP
ncbi:MAG TPA: alpha/beta fold hydrolase [Micromonosporaceae bacterium]|nr:alpha/beta fold hydrolase [Micromonosporaceae bacterium]